MTYYKNPSELEPGDEVWTPGRGSTPVTVRKVSVLKNFGPGGVLWYRVETAGETFDCGPGSLWQMQHDDRSLFVEDLDGVTFTNRREALGWLGAKDPEERPAYVRDGDCYWLDYQ